MKSSGKTYYFLVFHRVEPDEESIQYRRHAVRGVTCFTVHRSCRLSLRGLASFGLQGWDYWIVCARDVLNG